MDPLRNLLRSIPARWETPLGAEEALATLRGGRAQDGFLDLGSSGARVHVVGDRVRVHWGTRGERVHRILEAGIRAEEAGSVIGEAGSVIEGSFRPPWVARVLAGFVALFLGLWLLIVVGSVVDNGVGGLWMAIFPLTLVGMVGLYGRYAGTRASAEQQQIDRFVRTRLGISPRERIG